MPRFESTSREPTPTQAESPSAVSSQSNETENKSSPSTPTKASNVGIKRGNACLDTPPTPSASPKKVAPAFKKITVKKRKQAMAGGERRTSARIEKIKNQQPAASGSTSKTRMARSGPSTSATKKPTPAKKTGRGRPPKKGIAVTTKAPATKKLGSTSKNDKFERPAAIKVSNQESGRFFAEYEVERILDSRLKANDKIEYYVKWVGYPIEESSWEPASNLAHAEKKIADFNKKFPDKP
ncbi:hypothetical protein BP6252_01742 [Coleophoma cylindrospora]|uniref:Chromo domain-containing protein n=1 Tax=Coleophoma cylindrospora TaxID=1849047 RepID=A0A3D8STR5_9HELO|nr:hypothetical protein BP6252_01742 [Coleophoma cylindrospora]